LNRRPSRLFQFPLKKFSCFPRNYRLNDRVLIALTGLSNGTPVALTGSHATSWRPEKIRAPLIIDLSNRLLTGD